MAATGAMADFSRLPTQRKVLVFVVIAMLLGALYYQFVLKGLKQDVKEAEDEHESKVRTNNKLAGDLPAYEKLKTRFTQVQRIVTENQKALPTESELPAFFETLNRKVKDSGVEVTNWKQEKEETIETFVKVPVRIEISGTFMQIKRFFASLVQKKDEPKSDAPTNPDDPVKERERVVSIEGLALGDPKYRNREIILTAKFIAMTFRQDEVKVAPTPNAPLPAPTGGTTAPPMPTAGTPMPSAGTPNGAKVRVEDSMKKSVDRVDDKTTPPAGSGSARLKGGL